MFILSHYVLNLEFPFKSTILFEKLKGGAEISGQINDRHRNVRVGHSRTGKRRTKVQPVKKRGARSGKV